MIAIFSVLLIALVGSSLYYGERKWAETWIVTYEKRNDSSREMLKFIAEGKTENVVLSPYSVFRAFGMAYMGAKGNTADQINNTLQTSRLYPETGAEGYVMHEANALFVNQEIQLIPKYIISVEIEYGCLVKTVNVHSSSSKRKCVADINDFVKDTTMCKIPDFLSVDDIKRSTKLVILNAIYLKALWLNPFDDDATKSGEFWLNSQEKTTLPFMSQTSVFGNAVIDDVQIVRLPYKSSQKSMFIMMPLQWSMSLDDLLKKTNLSTMLKESVDIDKSNIHLKMPKFKIRSRVSMIETMKKLGITDAFDVKKADFRDMSGTPNLSVSDVIHEATISVDEMGTEASAASAVMMMTTSMPPINETLITLNRPFVYFIYDDNLKVVFFSGVFYGV